MRLRWLIWVLTLAASACRVSSLESANEPDHGGGALDDGCSVPEDCAPAAATCCACPTFAVTRGSELDTSCGGVDCPAPADCPDLVATCDLGHCGLICRAVVTSRVCEGGFVRDAAGCLTDACADPVAPPVECQGDPDCVLVAADCCGCELGGSTTAVPASQAEAFTAGLGCDGTRSCPGVDVCDPDAVARCAAGRCELDSSPAADQPDAGQTGVDPAGLCGTPAYPACPAGEVCVLNDPEAKVAGDLGVGICRPM